MLKLRVLPGLRVAAPVIAIVLSAGCDPDAPAPAPTPAPAPVVAPGTPPAAVSAPPASTAPAAAAAVALQATAPPPKFDAGRAWEHLRQLVVRTR